MTLDNSGDEAAKNYVEINGTQGVSSESANPLVNTVVKTGIAVDGQRPKELVAMDTSTWLPCERDHRDLCCRLIVFCLFFFRNPQHMQTVPHRSIMT